MKCLIVGFWKKSREKIKVNCLKNITPVVAKGLFIKLQLGVLYRAQVCTERENFWNKKYIWYKILSLGKLHTRKLFTSKKFMECFLFYTYPNSPVSLCWGWCDQQRTASVMLKIRKIFIFIYTHFYIDKIHTHTSVSNPY